MKYIRRLMWFIASRMIILSVIAGLLTVAFYLPMNAGNIYVLLNDGMRARAAAVIMRENPAHVNNFFTRKFLEEDGVLTVGLSKDSPYLNYTIKSFDHQLTMGWMWSWFWEDTAQAEIIERVPRIEGSIKSEKNQLVKDGLLPATPPKWNGGRYRAVLVRNAGQWMIASLTLLEVIEEPDPTPTITPTPKPTATPKPD